MKGSDGEARDHSGAQTLLRGLDLLEQVVREPMRMSELIARSSLTRSTTKRLAVALVGRGFLAQAPGGPMRGGPKLIRLGMLAQQRHDIVSVARPHLADLSAQTGLSSFLGRRDGDYSVHLHRAYGGERVMVATPVGTRRRLVETSMGKALLFDDPPETWRRLLGEAEPQFRTPGWEAQMAANITRGVVIHEGPPPDMIRAVAAPVRDATGRIAGAVSLAAAAQSLDADRLEPLGEAVRAAALAISAGLGWDPVDGPGAAA